MIVKKGVLSLFFSINLDKRSNLNFENWSWPYVFGLPCRSIITTLINLKLKRFIIEMIKTCIVFCSWIFHELYLLRRCNFNIIKSFLLQNYMCYIHNTYLWTVLILIDCTNEWASADVSHKGVANTTIKNTTKEGNYQR